MRRHLASPMPPDDVQHYAPFLSQIEKAIGGEAFAAASVAGQAMTWEQAVAFTLENIPPWPRNEARAFSVSGLPPAESQAEGDLLLRVRARREVQARAAEGQAEARDEAAAVVAAAQEQGAADRVLDAQMDGALAAVDVAQVVQLGGVGDARCRWTGRRDLSAASSGSRSRRAGSRPASCR